MEPKMLFVSTCTGRSYNIKHDVLQYYAMGLDIFFFLETTCCRHFNIILLIFCSHRDRGLTRFRLGNSNQIRGRLTPVSYLGEWFMARRACLVVFCMDRCTSSGVGLIDYGCPISRCAWASRLFFFRRVKDLRPFWHATNDA